MFLRALITSTIVFWVLVGCVSTPDGGGPMAAQRLKVALTEGCLPYSKGERTESEAMATARMTRIEPPSNPFTSPPGPDHMYRAPGNIIANLYRGRCTIHVPGQHPELTEVVEHALKDRLGPDYLARGTPVHLSSLPTIASFCLDGMIYSYYSVHPGSPGEGFEVEMWPRDCVQVR